MVILALVLTPLSSVNVLDDSACCFPSRPPVQCLRLDAGNLPSRMPTLRVASRPVSKSITRPPSCTRSYCCADTTVVDNVRRRREKISLSTVAPFGSAKIRVKLHLELIGLLRADHGDPEVMPSDWSRQTPLLAFYFRMVGYSEAMRLLAMSQERS
jgi:hypothetical protein